MILGAYICQHHIFIHVNPVLPLRDVIVSPIA